MPRLTKEERLRRRRAKRVMKQVAKQAAQPTGPFARRGVVSGWWTAAPVMILLAVAIGCSWLVLAESRPDHLPFVLSLYGCGVFFVHGYSVAWRAGTYLWQYLAMLLTVAILSFLAWIHTDDVATVLGGVGARGGPVLMVSVGCNAATAALLLVHCTVLGFGSREPLPEE